LSVDGYEFIGIFCRGTPGAIDVPKNQTEEIGAKRGEAISEVPPRIASPAAAPSAFEHAADRLAQRCVKRGSSGSLAAAEPSVRWYQLAALGAARHMSALNQGL
jgi:hypothetical protein